jgi:hypothetical protein
MRFWTTVIAALISMFMAASTLGQDLRNKVLVAYSLQPKPQVVVTNNYSARITGMAVVVSSTVAPYRKVETIWLDPGVNFRHDHPLESGASLPFPVGPAQLASQLQPQLMAVQFEDGTSAGDPKWLSELHLRRQAAYDEITQVDNFLNKALAIHQTNEQIVSALNGMHDSLKSSNNDLEAKLTARFVVEWTTIKLQGDTVGGVVGDPEKTIPTIVSRFAEWRGSLKRYDRKIS